MNVSAVIISLNEEGTIGECISQAMKCCKEVVVVDSGSTDNTVNIARSLGANVFITGWKGFGTTKNFGNQKAKNDWILSLDADEILSDDWINKNNDLHPEKGAIYALDIMTSFNGKWMRHSGFYPSWKKRLFNRNDCHWSDDAVHEVLLQNQPMKVKRLKGKVWHYSVRSVEAYRKKLDRYARLGAQKWIDQGIRPSSIKMLFGPSFHFIKTYFLNLGFLDGKEGLQLARLNSQANRAKLNYYLEKKELNK